MFLPPPPARLEEGRMVEKGQRREEDAEDDKEEEDFEFSRNYFLSKEISGRKSARKLSDITQIDELLLNFPACPLPFMFLPPPPARLEEGRMVEKGQRREEDAEDDKEEEDFEFSRNYFLSKEISGRKSARKLSDITQIDELLLNFPACPFPFMFLPPPPARLEEGRMVEKGQRREEDAEDDKEEEDFEFSRNYFLSKEISGRKSARKLSDITQIDELKLREAASNIVPKHEKEIKSLVRSYRDSYRQWLFELRCGFNLLVYGFGSKKCLLEDFASTSLDRGVIVINGYFQSVNVKQAAAAIAEAYWDQIKSKRRYSSRSRGERPFASESIEDIISFLDRDSSDDECFVCVVVHNIDGPGLRDSESQQILARIAACSHIQMVASIDHVNAPVLWDKKTVHTQFNWCWIHIPTFEPYKVEGMFFPLILMGGDSAQSAKTALIVLQSLTPNAQCVFKILAEYQLAHPKEEGMPRSTLYSTCRERFIVSSQMTLNSHLTEFKDHELVKTRKHSEGQDCYYIPLAADGLEKLLLELG